MTSRKRPRDENAPLVCQWDGCASCVHEDVKELAEHVNTVHANVKGTCCWNGCGYVGKTKQMLQNHARTHTGEKPYTCTVCDKTFTGLGALTTHVRTHTGEKPHKCTECEKEFSQLINLTTHMRTHTGIKPFECAECKKPFTQLAHLTTHMRTHTGEKPHKCAVCKFATTQSGSLKVHMRKHTGAKPFTCTVCDKAFTQRPNLNRHMRWHQGFKPHKCDLCTKAFSQKQSLESHIRRKHTGPWCVTCNSDKPCWVPVENMICGRCNMHANYGVKEKRFFDFVYDYDERLAEVCFTLRDEAMGCGVRKRPDGLMQLQTKAVCVDIEAAMETTLIEDDYRVKLIIECDEHQHNAYIPSCELARLQEIQERDNDAVYVLRYNVDQPDAFDEAKLAAFCDRVLAVLEGDFLLAVESPTLFEIEYFGYTEARKALLEEEMRRQYGFE